MIRAAFRVPAPAAAQRRGAANTRIRAAEAPSETSNGKSSGGIPADRPGKACAPTASAPRRARSTGRASAGERRTAGAGEGARTRSATPGAVAGPSPEARGMLVAGGSGRDPALRTWTARMRSALTERRAGEPRSLWGSVRAATGSAVEVGVTGEGEGGAGGGAGGVAAPCAGAGAGGGDAGASTGGSSSLAGGPIGAASVLGKSSRGST
jgi:hypothetical protein